MSTPTCPRCDGPLALFDGDIGAASRVSLDGSIRVCGVCGSDEAIRDAAGQPPVPPTDWPVALESVRVWPTGIPTDG
ncbi:hypothetical protein ACFC26_44170 [Kitasatospora purpeofusca]|uniref:hypothetical protein n=1 Tax=Kitasatospora purpeofusca TaxID=67352 RepID=UPI0035D79FEE